MIPDPLDARLGYVTEAGRPSPRRWMRVRLALGLSPTPAPGLVLLPLGVALGPYGLGLLSPTVLSHLDPAVSVAIATLGVFIGLGLDARRPYEGRLLAAASVEGALTISLVGAGILIALRLAQIELGLAAWVVAPLLGICAASSSTAAIEGSDSSGVQVARIGDLDDVLPIVLGAVALAALRETDSARLAVLATQSAVIALAIAFAGWLLVSQAASESEQRVFGVGTLLLLGGTVEYLSLSGLFAGLIAGAVWNAAGGPGRDRLERDVRHVQHPLVVLLVLVAGARFIFSPGVALLVCVYLLFRIAGKMAGGWIARRIAGRDLPPRLGLYLVSPGVLAIAFGLNAIQAAGPDRAAIVLAVAVAGSFGSAVISHFVHPREAPS
ncbi:MAG TPA: hypothetical protein VHI98_28500 [Vicinamibacterales bacterium]|jgi:hypothetical protein|nr:hypothetical protein [Vicinamibacterales bacterium]